MRQPKWLTKVKKTDEQPWYGWDGYYQDEETGFGIMVRQTVLERELCVCTDHDKQVKAITKREHKDQGFGSWAFRWTAFGYATPDVADGFASAIKVAVRLARSFDEYTKKG